MRCCELAARIEQLRPGAPARDVARLCLLLAGSVENLDELQDDDKLAQVWHSTSLKLEHATDQHAAMTDELEELSRSDPADFTPDQIWVLIRAIKVQSQVLQLYVGQPALDA